MKRNVLLIMICLLSGWATAQTNSYSVWLDGVDDYISVPDNNVFNPSNSITISAWIKADSWAGSAEVNNIVGKDNWDNSTTTGYALRNYENGRLSFVFGSAANWRDVISAPDMLTSVWYYVTGTYNGTQSKVYINGVPKGELFYSGTITTSADPIAIGRTPFAGAPVPRSFDGRIDQVEIWNIGLDSAQINQYMECSPTGNETGLVGFWDLDEGTGTLAADKTVYNNDGQLISGTNWSDNVQAICSSIGISDKLQNDYTVEIYPNPNNGVFELKLHGTSVSYFEISNMLGEQVYTVKLSSNKTEIDLSGHAAGIYLYQLRTDNDILKTGKLIIE